MCKQTFSGNGKWWPEVASGHFCCCLSETVNARVNCLHLPNNSLRSHAIAFHHYKEEHLFVNQNLFSEIRPGVDTKTNSPRNPADNCRVEALLCFSPDHDCCNLQICCHPSKICRRTFFPSLCGRSRWWYILRTQRRCNNTLGKFWNIFNKRQLIYMMLRSTGLKKYPRVSS